MSFSEKKSTEEKLAELKKDLAGAGFQVDETPEGEIKLTLVEEE